MQAFQYHEKCTSALHASDFYVTLSCKTPRAYPQNRHTKKTTSKPTTACKDLSQPMHLVFSISTDSSLGEEKVCIMLRSICSVL